MKTRVFAWSLYFLYFTALLQTVNGQVHTPKLVWGNINNSNGSSPNPADITFSAYITSRPTDTLTQASPGCLVQSNGAQTQYQIECGSFIAQWQAGDMITVAIQNNSNGEAKTATLTLDSSPTLRSDLTLIASVAPNVPAITSATTASGSYGQNFNYAITASNGPNNYSATGLPSGLSVNATTGAISGTPTMVGTISVTIGATNGSGTGTATLTISIGKAALTVTADNQSRVYGAINPALTLSYNGLVNNDTVATITAPTASTTATVASAVGTYPITLTGGSAANYALTLVNGTFTVTKAALTVTADNQSRNYGAANPTFTISYTGFVNGDTVTAITPPAISTTATTSSAAGTYPITLTGGSAANYTLTLVNGTLTVNPPNTAPTITTQPYSQTTAAGGNVSFTAVASGTPTPTYQWQYSTNGGASWANVPSSSPYSGVATGTLSITSVTTGMNGYQYRCVATNSVSSTNSNAITLTLTVTDALVAYYPFDGNANDLSGNGHNGTVIGATLTQDRNGLPSQAYDFNGASLVDCGNSSAFQFGNANFTISAWVYQYTTPTSTEAVILSKDQIYSLSSQFRLSTNSGKVYFEMTDASGLEGLWSNNGQNLSADLPANQWTHIAVVRSGLNFALYINGQSKITYVSPNNVAPSSNLDFLIGARFGSSGGYADYFRGIIDEVRIYNHALSAADVQLLAYRDYSGTYFGTLTSGGHWALYVRANNTATYIAYLRSRHSAIVVSLTVGEDGAFTVTGTEIVPLTNTAVSDLALASPEAPVLRTATAAAAYTLTGQIGFDGAITGQLFGLGETFTGAADPATGSAPAGLYTAAALNSASGATYTIVSASGQAVVVTTTPAAVDGAAGTVNSSGQLTATTSNNAALTVTINASAQTASASLTPAGSTTPITYAGASDTYTPVVGGHLVNLSSRAAVGTGDNVLIVGFVITGSAQKPVIIRGVGPALAVAPFNMTGTLPDPLFDLYHAGAVVGHNDNWATAGDPTTVAATMARVGAFSLPSGSPDSVISTTLNPGVYSAILYGNGSTNTGVGMVEIYDSTAAFDPTTPRMVNISSRGLVGTGDNVLIGGFVVTGDQPRQVLIRGVGPTLTSLGVTGTVLADPILYLYHSGVVINQNDNWGSAGDGAAISAAATAVGAFVLPSGSKDAALLTALQPGVYSVIVAGVNNATGIALVEVYEIGN